MPDIVEEGRVTQPETEDADARSGGTGSARKILTLLFSFSEYRRDATVAELAETIGASVPTAYRLVALLKDMNLLEEGTRGRYHPTVKVMPLARAAQLASDIARVAAPIVEETSRELRETVMLMQYFGDAAVCIELSESDRPMRFVFQRGHTLPLGRGASGKMVLASLPAKAQAAVLGRDGQLAGLESELSDIRARGYAVSRGEVDDGVWACSAPVTLDDDRPVVLTAACPSARMSEDAKERAIELVVRNAARIRDALRPYSL